MSAVLTSRQKAAISLRGNRFLSFQKTLLPKLETKKSVLFFSHLISCQEPQQSKMSNCRFFTVRFRQKNGQKKPKQCSKKWDFPINSSRHRPNFPAASSNGWRLQGHWL